MSIESKKKLCAFLNGEIEATKEEVKQWIYTEGAFGREYIEDYVKSFNKNFKPKEITP